MSGPTTRPIPLRQPLDHARGFASMTEDEKKALRDYDKEVVKEALKEWLDEKFADFGKWSFAGVAAAVLAIIAYMILVTHGWKSP